MAMSTQAWASTPVTLTEFEDSALTPKVWVVNIPNDNASVELSTEQHHEGKQSLKLHYKFTEEGDYQYLGIPIPIKKIKAPVHKLRYWLRGDGSLSTYGLQVTDISGETHQFSKRNGKSEAIDYSDWKEVEIDLDEPHEAWGGDKNGKMDYPITGVTLTVGQPMEGGVRKGVESDLFFDSLSVESGKSAEETLDNPITVSSPAYGAEIQGDITVNVSAPGFRSVVAKCWKAGPRFGTDATVARVSLDAKGQGSFAFPASDYPHGPITVRISGENGDMKDNCYLQLYNTGGVSWNEGLPPTPPQAEGMKLVFEDDFKGPLSIGPDPSKTYYEHKPPDGSQDFSGPAIFRNFDSPENPFAQTDTYLRIRADTNKNSAGLISSIHGNGSGVKASVPCYFECRFIGPNAPGTWPAFWLMTDYSGQPSDGLVDELDIIEAYGGEGQGSPNAFDTYLVTPHVWNYAPAEKEKWEEMLKKKWPYPYIVSMKKLGIPSTWYETPHTYGCMVTETETTYYCDNIKIGSHPTLPICKEKPLFFMVNLATGGGWPVDLSRYGGVADMYVDFVRVYQGKTTAGR